VERPLGPATRAVHAGLPDRGHGEPFLPGPTFAAPFHLSGDPEGAEFVYGRYGNPTWSRCESALGELEDAEAVLFGSGMAAVAAVLLPSLGPGDVLVAPSDCYLGTRSLIDAHLAELGVDVRYAPTTSRELRDAVRGASLVWLETPSNPGLDVCDIAAFSEAARAEGAALAVDNTLATPLGQRPLDLGADGSDTSDSKLVTGHSDLILGHVATRDPVRADRLRTWRTRAGSVAGPFEAWLAHRSLATLGLRVERACANAVELARLLAARVDVADVRYPGLEGDPAHRVAAAQMDRFGPVLTFTLETRERAERFLRACRLVAESTSFGGLHTTAERRARWGDPVPEGLIRLSAGCEDAADLLADVDAALAA
jgi:cystathionine gamma-lyase